MTKMQRLEHENEMMKRTLKSIRNLYALTEEERVQHVREEGGGMGDFYIIAAAEILAEVRSTLKAVGEEPKC